MPGKRKLSAYMDTLSLDDAPVERGKKKLKPKMCSVHCQTEENIYTESDIKKMIDNYINHYKIDDIDKLMNLKSTHWVESF
jgi:hypothetical protein